MVESGPLLRNEEVDFLLQAGSEGGNEPERLAEPQPEQEVTMRGDLDKINLSDIFQTLAMSKLEGMLRIRNPIEQRNVFFHDGAVRLLLPARYESKRLGQRLIRAGMITADQLRSALVNHRKDRRRLSDILIAEKLVPAETVDELVATQIADELYSLFTWRHGSFEFYKGPVQDPLLRGRLDDVQRFDVNGVLLEVARRADEWEVIQQTLGSIDEVPVRRPDADASNAGEVERAVCEAVNGRTSIRDLADQLLLSPFECARAVKQLYDQELLDLASIQHLLDVADGFLAKGDNKRAILVLQAAHDRPQQEKSLEVVRMMSGLLHRAGDARLASQYLINAACTQVDDLAEAMQLAREARAIDRGNPEALQFLLGLLVRAPNASAEEIFSVGGDLSDALAEANRLDEALQVCTEIEQRDPKHQPTILRRVRLLAKLNRGDEAVQILESLAEQLRSERKFDRLAGVYEQILKIDYRRKDIAKALKGLRASRNSRLLKLGGLMAGALAVLAAVLLVLQSVAGRRDLAQLAERVQEAVRNREFDQAERMIDEAIVANGESETLLELRASIGGAIAEAKAELERKREERMVKELGDAADLLDQGRLVQALDAYGKLIAQPATRAEAQRIATARVSALLPRMEQLARSLPHLVPPPPDPSQTEAMRKKATDDLATYFKPADRTLCQAILDNRDDPRLNQMLGAESRRELLEWSDTVRAAFDQAADRERQYLEARARSETARRLDPLFLAAREHESRHEFAKALEAYRRLANEHPAEDQLKAHFRDQVERFATIVRFQQIVAKAAQEGDFATAQGQLRALRRSFPQIPFDQICRLPLRVETLPNQAKVTIDGEDAGTAPLLTAYLPARDTKVRAEMDGFHAAEVTVRGDTVGTVRLLLARKADWSVTMPGVVERTPVSDGAGHVFLTDRSGAVHALDLRTGEVRWTIETGDLSGLLTRPLLHGNRVVVGSVDGTLRAFEASTGKTIWSRDQVPMESNPILVDGRVLIFTTDGKAHGVHPDTGEIAWSRELPAPAIHSPAALADGAAVALRDGQVVRLRATSGQTVWLVRVANAGLTAPVAAPGSVVVGAEEGSLTALALDDGRRLWRRDELGEITLAPAVHEGSVIVADSTSLHAFSLAKGEPRGTWKGDAMWSTTPVVSGDLLLIGNRSGIVTVFEASTLQPRYRIRGQKTASAPVLALGRDVVASFGDRQVQGLLRLP